MCDRKESLPVPVLSQPTPVCYPTKSEDEKMYSVLHQLTGDHSFSTFYLSAAVAVKAG